MAFAATLDQVLAQAAVKLRQLLRMPLREKLRVQQAAIQTQTGEVFTVPRPGRHGDVLRVLSDKGVSQIGRLPGFVLSDGRFVDRKEAAQIAFRAGQYLTPPATQPGLLFSEDLW
jgi:hypothetical protein